MLIVELINITAQILIALIVIWVIASWVLSPYHPIREAMDRIIEPLLAPIRRLLPATGPVDFSPMILMVAIILIARVLTALLLSF
ncbi:MAG TPA: YggT family protein [Anaerolineales bacterium]